jgi:hypothetical protein
MDVQVLCGDGAAPAVALQHAGGVRGGIGTMLLLALPPATSADAAGPGGDWLLTVGARGDQAIHVDVFVARSETEMGAPQRHRPSKLMDPSCDPHRYLREAEEDPTPSGTRPAIQVVREGTVGSPASCAGVVAVGGLRLRESVLNRSKPGMQPAPESGEGLAGNAWAAPMDESKAAPGIPGIGSRSASVSRLRGTSFAAPQVARTLADESLLQTRGPRGEPPEQGPWPHTKGPDPRKGQGYVIPRAG